MRFGGKRIDLVGGQPLTVPARPPATLGRDGIERLGRQEQRGIATDLADDAHASADHRQDQAPAHVPTVDEHSRAGLRHQVSHSAIR